MEAVVVALIGAVGGLASGVVAALVTLKSKGLDELIENRKLIVTAYDSALLQQRLLEYKKLWKLTEPTSRRHVENLRKENAKKLSEDLTNWYYSDGGMVLSSEARDAFFAARNSLNLTSAEIDTDRISAVVDGFSALRTALCDDMNARRGPTLKGKES